MRREIPTSVAVVVIAVVVVVVIVAYVVIGRRGSLQPTAPPPGWKPQPMGPYKGKGMPSQPGQVEQPAQTQSGTQ